MNAWSQLPNAHLIDWALESVKNNPHMWSCAWDVTWHAARHAAWHAAWHAARNAAWHAARNAAYDAAYNAALSAAWNAAYNVTWNEAHNATWNEARNAARLAAWDSILALIVYDDCQKYLDMTYDQLKVYALLSERPQAILLLPMKWVQENECMVTTA